MVLLAPERRRDSAACRKASAAVPRSARAFYRREELLTGVCALPTVAGKLGGFISEWAHETFGGAGALRVKELFYNPVHALGTLKLPFLVPLNNMRCKSSEVCELSVLRSHYRERCQYILTVLSSTYDSNSVRAAKRALTYHRKNRAEDGNCEQYRYIDDSIIHEIKKPSHRK
eukprot:6198203-Pleurochrysis_carterae.AAC.1